MEQVLTERERIVVFLLAKGLHNEQIANALFISQSTVKSHIESIFEKLEVKNRIQAALKALYLGLFELKDVVELN